MGSYIASATKNIETISEEIIRSEHLSAPSALRIGLIAYRDHPPQDHTYIVKNFGFTESIDVIKANLGTLYASGGGDGPEAVTAAMKAALDLDWRPEATRLAVLIADAPPHGIGEYGDGFTQGSPDGFDPLQVARAMAASGIPLFMVACEPALSGYQHAADFYQGLVRITGGQLLPLTTASLLAPVIIGAAGECMSLDRLHREIGDQVAQRIAQMSLDNPAENDVMDSVTRDLYNSLTLRREVTKQLIVESIYRETPESLHNVQIWSTAPDLASARPHIRRVTGSRLSEKYLRERSVSSAYKPFTPYAHPRTSGELADGSGSSRSAMAYIFGFGSSSSSRTSAGYGRFSSAGTSPEGGRGGFGASPSSPPGSRKVVSDFSAFSAKPGTTFGGTPSSSPQLDRNASGDANQPSSPTNPWSNGPRSGAAFSNPRSRFQSGGGMDDDDDDDDVADKIDDGMDDDDDGDVVSNALKRRPGLPVQIASDGALQVAGDDGSTLALKQGAISIEQVRRLAMFSARRSGF
ncbi:hypothetical protein UM01098.1 [Ceraceosorus bombacis]|uniref:VWFA domain-containing protein n=1 Tax=Ceraceosorus bombacis TaxID=401625 RepID=A0A0P1BJF8_9BASI|nr:hypothetical protein UM01098.1 [Ceraceosorus bombacis]